MMREGTNVDLRLLSSALSHELGHAFGLADTYLSAHLRQGGKSSGGLDRTVGTQPSSEMAGLSPGVGEDDKRGIIWLYKASHEGIETKDCLFSDYVYEEETSGCRPKHPLIFETRYGYWLAVFHLLDQDPTIDVNTQDPSGMTALHHAAALDRKRVVERLLEHKDIDPSLRDKQGRTALDIARGADLTEIIALLQADTRTASRRGCQRGRDCQHLGFGDGRHTLRKTGEKQSRCRWQPSRGYPRPRQGGESTAVKMP